MEKHFGIGQISGEPTAEVRIDRSALEMELSRDKKELRRIILQQACRIAIGMIEDELDPKTDADIYIRYRVEKI